MSEKLIEELNLLIERKDVQIDQLVADRNRLRDTVKRLMAQHEEDTRRISELLVENINLSSRSGETK